MSKVRNILFYVCLFFCVLVFIAEEYHWSNTIWTWLMASMLLSGFTSIAIAIAQVIKWASEFPRARRLMKIQRRLGYNLKCVSPNWPGGDPYKV